MATTRHTWFGIVVEFDNVEANHIAHQVNAGAATVGTIAAVLAGMGVTGAASVVPAIISGLLWLGSAALGICNSQQNGIRLYIPWTGTPWCRPR